MLQAPGSIFGVHPPTRLLGVISGPHVQVPLNLRTDIQEGVSGGVNMQ